MTSSLGDRVRSLRLPPPSSSRSGVGSIVPWVLCAVLAVGCGVLGYLAFVRFGAQTAAAAAAGESQATEGGSQGNGGAEAAAVPSGKFALESKGYIIPYRRILVSPKVSGLLVKLNIEEGDVVPKGFELGEIENDEYQAELSRAIAARDAAQQRRNEAYNGPRQQEIEQVHAELEEAQRQIVQYDADLQRAKDLRTSNVISQQEYDAVIARSETMQKRLARLDAAANLIDEGTRKERKLLADAELDQAKAELAKAQWRFDNCKIKAPIKGTILKKNTEEGNIVNAIAFNGSFSLCEMADLADLEVDLNIQERDVSRIFVGQKCKIRAEAFPKIVYDGTVTRLMPIADRAKGAIPVRVKVKLPPGERQGQYLKPDMGAVVAFLNEE